MSVHAQKRTQTATMFLKFLSSHIHAAVWREARTWPKFEGKPRKLNYEIKENNTQLHINLLRNTVAAAASTDQPSQACLKVFHFLSSSLLFPFIAYTFSSLFDFLFFRCSILCYFFNAVYKVFFSLFTLSSKYFFFPSTSTTIITTTTRGFGSIFCCCVFLCVCVGSFQTIIIVGCCNSAVFLADGWLVCSTDDGSTLNGFDAKGFHTFIA